MPKSIKVYVANDGSDCLDFHNLDMETDAKVTNRGNYISRMIDVMENVKKEDFRAGAINISRHRDQLHLNPPFSQGRSPLTSFVMSFRFTNSIQFADYIYSINKYLFGAHELELVTMDNAEDQVLTLPEFMHEWLMSEFGAVYDNLCFVECIHKANYQPTLP